MNAASIIVPVGAAIQLLAAGAVMLYTCRALLALTAGQGIDMARLFLAEGVLAALGFSLAATLLNVIGLGTWTQIRTFTAVFILRTLLKQVFLGERRTSLARRGTSLAKRRI